MLPKDIKSSKVTKKWLAIIRSYVEAGVQLISLQQAGVNRTTSITTCL